MQVGVVEESQGETVSTRTDAYGGVLQHETETELYDGTTPTAHSHQVEAIGLLPWPTASRWRGRPRPSGFL